jgi:hypothetical protein
MQVIAARATEGSAPPRELRSTAILLTLTLSRVMARLAERRPQDASGRPCRTSADRKKARQGAL